MVLSNYDDASAVRPCDRGPVCESSAYARAQASHITFSSGWTPYGGVPGYYNLTFTQRTTPNQPAAGLHADIPFDD